jgi:cell filamentation protein
MSKDATERYFVPTGEDLEPNAELGVLRNFLNIKSKEEIEALEAAELERTELELVKLYTAEHKFTVEDICNIHELWLGDIYPSAGKFRTVIISKGGFLFAAPNYISRLMRTLEKKYLAKYTPCYFHSDEELAYALGVVHIELILIHPFREGNGRTARLLADLMSLQSDRPPLNFISIDHTQNETGFNRYIQAIQAGHREILNQFKKFLDVY